MIKIFFAQSIEATSTNIQQADPDDYNTLSDLYSSRGEDYLILDEDQNALTDFLLSYEYALNCNEQDNNLLFRSLFGAFLVHIRSENIESAQEIFARLQSILSSSSCNECKETRVPLTSRYFKGIFTSSSSHQGDQPDWPIIGPDQIPTRDCLERVATTSKAVRILIAAVKKSEVRTLATLLIDELSDTASRCCRAGGIWKGCLQKLANKLYYWKVLGVPADPAWD